MVTSILPLQVQNAIVRKQGHTILGPIDLTLSGDETLVIIGPNGSGKTTLLRMLHGLERVKEGKIEWSVDQKTALAHQSFVFQTPIMLRRSVIENVIYPLRLQKTSSANMRRKGQEWLERVGLSDLANLDATSLSGGEKQKLALARALIVNPQLLFLDEPTANLDGKSTREIETILDDAVQTGVRIVMTTHDMGQAKRLAGDIVFLHRGRLHERSDPSSFFDNPKTSEARLFLKGEIVE